MSIPTSFAGSFAPWHNHWKPLEGDARTNAALAMQAGGIDFTVETHRLTNPFTNEPSDIFGIFGFDLVRDERGQLLPHQTKKLTVCGLMKLCSISTLLVVQPVGT